MEFLPEVWSILHTEVHDVADIPRREPGFANTAVDSGIVIYE